jgi:asparagine synthase (glutamine-hydrolysing)
MCGICGIVDFNKRPLARTVGKMNDALKHRGPDMGGIHSFSSCILGHRRLSILDLSCAAKQPMVSDDGNVGVVFNGEIYNFMELRSNLESRGHGFVTTSDTEVLLKSYQADGADILQSLNGMFAFAIWDDRKRELTIARDRVGKKPLYYCLKEGRFSFSSELQSLVQDEQIPRDISQQALQEYLLYDFIPAPHSVFAAINKLPAGCSAVVNRCGIRLKRYWKPTVPEKDLDYTDSKRQLRNLLQDAVDRRLISDVPLGSFLSGGLDSTLITALMNKKAAPVRTFSISFPGATHDESQWSRFAADSMGTIHTQKATTWESRELLPTLVRHFGEPFADSSAIPTYNLCKITRENVTVALSGDGGDELFGGYERYLARKLQTLYDLAPRIVRRHLIEPLAEALPETTDYYGTSLIKKLKLFCRAARRMDSDPLCVTPRTFSAEDLLRLTGFPYDSAEDPVMQITREYAGLDPISHMMISDVQTYMAEDILTKVDRMSMAHALEVRSPLLDYRIVELACRMPGSFKIRGFTQKNILKETAADLVPREIINRKKYGFQVPIGLWFKTDLKQWGYEQLIEAPRHNLLNMEEVKSIWNAHQKGRADNGHKIWSLLVLNEWFRQMR